MICKNCGAENAEEKFCVECGAPLTEEAANAAHRENAAEAAPDSAAEYGSPESRAVTGDEPPQGDEPNEEILPIPQEDADSGEPISDEVREARENLEKYEAGTITHPNAKPQKKRSFYCPQNPMLWSFAWLLAFAAALGGLTALFFSINLEGTQIIFGIVFSVFTAVVLAIDFGYYLPAALTLSRLLRGKGVKLEYKLKDYELVEQAEKAKKRNRGFYLAIGLFGLAFSIYYIYILATAIVQTRLMWISLIFSICVFVIFALLFFIMPKFNYERMMQGGSRVIIGENSVYYGGNYYHWRNTRPEATYGNINSRKHELQLTFVQEFKNGKTQRRKVELYIPDRELRNATNLINAYEISAKAYQEKQLKNSVLNEKQDKK